MKLTHRLTVLTLATILTTPAFAQSIADKIRLCNSGAALVSAVAQARDVNVNKQTVKTLFAESVSNLELNESFDTLVDTIYQNNLTPNQLEQMYKHICYKRSLEH